MFRTLARGLYVRMLRRPALPCNWDHPVLSPAPDRSSIARRAREVGMLGNDEPRIVAFRSERLSVSCNAATILIGVLAK